jgi:hypothetical protein
MLIDEYQGPVCLDAPKLKPRGKAVMLNIANFSGW